MGLDLFCNNAFRRLILDLFIADHPILHTDILMPTLECTYHSGENEERRIVVTLNLQTEPDNIGRYTATATRAQYL